ncbi:drug/metabolite transporter, DME family [Nakamurella panacisegetis]|uniref:Drug/metabolite transporter, DME family n=1 Tax=Nakamurella panacisegetis TaxID=1090615 RepID=A0A1H0SFY6_9ACTN|nr:DMT family transporter [Nakamurella panacisegetis]SDP40610.1 drug/metabolite transporter, DME family [Nakamurella panacisegetis]
MFNPLVVLSAARTRTTTAIGHRLGLVQISLAAALWGTTGVVVRKLHESSDLGPVAIGFYRLLAAAALLLIASGPTLRRSLRGLASHPWSLVGAGVGLGIYQVLYFISVADVGVGVATVVSLGIAPIITTVIEAVRTRRRPGVRTVLVVTAAVLGLGLVALASSGGATAAAPRPGLGLLAAVGSGVSYALTTIVSRHAAQGISAVVMATTSTVIGTITLLPMALISGAGFVVTGAAVSLILYLGAATTVLAYALFYAGLRSTPSSVASVLTLIEPLTATVLAVVLLAEPLPMLTVVGGVLLLSAVCVLYLAPAAARPDPR